VGPTFYKIIISGVISVNLHTHTETSLLQQFSSFLVRKKERLAKRRRFLSWSGSFPCPCPHARARRHRLRSEQPVSLLSSARQHHFARLFRSRILGSSTGPVGAKRCSVSCCVFGCVSFLPSCSPLSLVNAYCGSFSSVSVERLSSRVTGGGH
jgi:hypothetical protein